MKLDIRSGRAAEIVHLARTSEDDDRNLGFTKNADFFSFFHDPISSFGISDLPVA